MKRYFLNYPRFQWPLSRLAPDVCALLDAIRNPEHKHFYEKQARANAWDAATLQHHMQQGLFERLAMDAQGAEPQEIIKDAYDLGFLAGQPQAAQDETVIDSVVAHLERFLLEMGRGFAFVERGRRIVVGGQVHRIPLVLYHRGLRRAVLVNILDRRFQPQDVGVMNMWRTYVARTDAFPGEFDPVGLLICADPDHAMAHYALGDLEDRIFVSRLLLELPGEDKVAAVARDAARDMLCAS